MIQIESGLFSGMVMQRRRGGVTAQPIFGRVEVPGAHAVQLRVFSGKRALASFEGEAPTKLKQGAFKSVLAGLAVGGPYRVELGVLNASGKKLESASFDDIYVGDVWILAGQSNMEGIGFLDHRPAAIPEVRAFYMEHTWRPAQDPLHELEKSVVRVHHQLHGGKAPARPTHIGAGPGVAFGQALYEQQKVPVGLLACAHGGTSMNQWDPKALSEGDASLFGAAVHRLRLNGGGLAGVYWYQGCSDTNEVLDVEHYTDRMKRLINAFRKEAGAPKLPFVLVQLSRFVYDGVNKANWSQIREQQRLLPKLVPGVATVPAIDLELDDSIHVSGESQNVLGQRSAEAALSLLGVGKAKPPIRLGHFWVVKDPNSGLANVEVEFEELAGALKSGARPNGFSLHTLKSVVEGVVKVTLQKNKAIIMTNRTTADVAGLRLAYGYGNDPYCNITDAEGRPLPAFGPVPLGKRRAITEFAEDVEVSRILPGVGQLKGLKYPASPDKLGFKARHFSSGTLGVFLSLRPEIEAYREDGLVYYRFTLEAPEAMSGRLCLGYDGPLKIWLNKREVFFDPNGTNPVSLDEAFAKVDLKAGRSEVLVALGTNHGKAWGMVLRFERTKAVTARGKDASPILPSFVAAT
ncbi:MAG: sialate O-acetylesterase [Polyangiaceae bacterium]|nr:sialate O-acetylesterase [Polyangiaceae bacterium]